MYSQYVDRPFAWTAVSVLGKFFLQLVCLHTCFVLPYHFINLSACQRSEKVKFSRRLHVVVVNGPLKNESWQVLSKFWNLAEPTLLLGLGVSDFVSVGHIYAFLSSH